MSPRKALDQSLLQQLLCMRESLGEDVQQNKKITQLDVAPGNQSVILILFPAKVSLGPRPSQGQSLSLGKAILRKMMLVMNNKKKPYQILVLETLTR